MALYKRHSTHLTSTDTNSTTHNTTAEIQQDVLPLIYFLRDAGMAYFPEGGATFVSCQISDILGSHAFYPDLFKVPFSILRTNGKFRIFNWEGVLLGICWITEEGSFMVSGKELFEKPVGINTISRFIRWCGWTKSDYQKIINDFVGHWSKSGIKTYIYK